MKRWIKVLLLTLLAGVVIAGLGSVLPALAADGDVVLYRVNSGGPEVPAIDDGPDWDMDLWNGPSQYYTGASASVTFHDAFTGSIGNAPNEVFKRYREISSTGTIQYAFPVEAGREYTINLYFTPHYWAQSSFRVRVDDDYPAEFSSIVVPQDGPAMMRTATVRADDDGYLNIDWVGSEGVVSAVEIIGPPPDSTPPEVEITNPVDGDIVSGVIRIEADADDNMAVEQVEFFVDGESINVDRNGLNGWSIWWDTSEGLDGEHTLKAVATDTAGNSAEHSITVTVDNSRPDVSFITPVNLQTVAGMVSIEASASDPHSGITSVEFWVDGVLQYTDTDSTDGWTWTWDASALENGDYILGLTAVNGAGLTNNTSIQVVVDNGPPPDTTPPTVSITSPADGSTVAGVTTIIASATDDGTVTRVEFFVDGTSIGADENGADGWSVDWDTTGDVDGWHVLTAKATDDSNNTGESDGVGVLVDNIPTVLEIVRPTSGAPVSGQVEIALSGSPDLMWVEVYLDGEYLDEATLVDGVWTLLWDTTAFEDGVYTLTAYGMTELEQGIESQAMQVTVQNTETPPDDDDDDDEPTPPEDEPTPTVPDVLPAMLCDLDDGSLNAHHCGRPVAIFRSGDELHLYGIDINTGNGSLALLVTAADIESAGVPEDVPVLIAVGENPYTHRPIALYRLPGGEFQLNTAYWDGKEYIVKWQPGAAHVEVIYW